MKQPTKKLNIIRLMAVLMVCSILIGSSMISVSAVESGECGEDMTWSLDAGTLTISGKGPMKDFKDSELAPWYEFRDQIIRLNISDTVTSIGNYAFYSCKNLVSVSIPNSVKTIGKYAFASCERLASVYMGGALSSIGDGAFYNCYALESIRLPYGLSNLGSQAFYRCESLRSISIPADVRTMGDSVFAYCKNLVRAQVYARIQELPEWTFYGCAQLSEVHLAETITSIGNFGFQKCDMLSTVYYPGTERNATVLKAQISQDVASFTFTGYITDDVIPDKSLSGERIEQEDDTVVQIDTTVLSNNVLVMSYSVERTYKPSSDQKGTYVADIALTIERNESWIDAGNEVINALTSISNTYSNLAIAKGITVTVYVGNDAQISKAFLNRLAGKQVELVVILANGSSWSMNCENLKIMDVDADDPSNYSHTIKEAPAEVEEKLGTDDCFQLVFDESTTQKAEVIVQLPPETATQANAFLYKVEEDGSYTKLQATAVDNNGCAHFFIASVDKYTDYIVALNVPNEDTSDVIIPEELVPPAKPNSPGSSALERLEDVKYVETGRNYEAVGFGYGGLTWILIGVLVGTTVLVGGIMMIWQKSKKTRIPVFEEQNAD